MSIDGLRGSDAVNYDDLLPPEEPAEEPAEAPPAEAPPAAATTPLEPQPIGHPVLSRGASGPEVYALQKLVNIYAHGHPMPPVPYDGEFDGRLFTAIWRIQSRERLPKTGTADQATWAALEFKKNLFEIKYGPVPEPVPEPKYPRATSFSDEIDGRPLRP